MKLTKIIETLLAARKSVADLRAAQPDAVTIQLTSGKAAPVHFTLLAPGAVLQAIEHSLQADITGHQDSIRAEIARLQALLVDEVPPTAPPEREVLGWFFKVTADGGTGEAIHALTVHAGDTLRGPIFGAFAVAMRRMGQGIIVQMGSGETNLSVHTLGSKVTHVNNESVAGYGITRFVVKAGE